MSSRPGRVRPLTHRLLVGAAVLGTAFWLTACGGGGGSPDTSPSSADKPNVTPTSTTPKVSGTVSGTAATGAALPNATVTLKDSGGKLLTSTTDAQGHFKLNWKEAQAPGLLRVTATVNGAIVQLYAPVTETDLEHTTNINQLTDLVVASIAGGSPSAYFDKGDFSALQRSRIDAALTQLQRKLAALLNVAGLHAYDFLQTSFTADHTGIDKVLDILSVNLDAPNKRAVIHNSVDGQSVDAPLPLSAEDASTLELATPEVWPIFFSPHPNVAAYASIVQTLVQQVNTALLASGTPSTDWCDGDSFQDSNYKTCADWAKALQSLTNKGQKPLLLKRIVAFDTGEVGNDNADRSKQGLIADDTLGALIQPKEDNRIFDILAVRLTLKNGQWRLSGDQRLINVAVRGYLNKTFDVMFPTQPNRSYVDVGVSILSRSTNYSKADGFRFVGWSSYDRWQLYDNLNTNYREITYASLFGASPPLSGQPVYTLSVLKGDQVVATYKTRLLSMGLKSYDTTGAASFPEILSHPGAADCAAGTTNVKWSLPAGYVNVDVMAACANNLASNTGPSSSQATVDLLGAPRAQEAPMTMSSRFPKVDYSEVVLRSVGPDGFFYNHTHSYDIAFSGSYITSGVSVDGRALYGLNATRGQIDQTWLNWYNGFYTPAHFESDGDNLLTKICGADHSLLYVNVAPFAAIDPVSDFSPLKGHSFRNISCLPDENKNSLNVDASGAITLTSNSLSQDGGLQTRVYSAADQPALLSEVNPVHNQNGSITWLRPIQVAWNNITEYILMEVTSWPDAKKVITSFWRMLTT
jgi:hypothetical protein